MNAAANRHSSGGNGAWWKASENVGPEEANLVLAAFPEELHGVGDDVREPREDDALALAHEAVDQGPPEVPHDAALHRGVAPEL
eukprot:10088527-Alexandrium_andersonii.AAC.1